MANGKKIRVAINGFGRIGRTFFRAARDYPALDIIAINDIGDIENAAYLLGHDSVYGKYPEEVKAESGTLIVGKKRISYLSEKDPAKLPWRDMNIDVVVESTGAFNSFEKASAHMNAGGKRVVITAPVKDTMPNAATVLMGLNEEKFRTCTITSNASCTTNSAHPVIAILDEKIGIERALLNTIHAATATQSLVDAPVKGKDYRRGRAAGHNIVPSSTGAAISVTQAYTTLAGKFDGIALRVPVIVGSVSDITFIAKRETTAEEVNRLLQTAAQEKRWKGIFSVTREPLVSSDIIGRTEGSIADLSMTRVVGNLVKVLSWYDNEMGYVHSLAQHVQATGAHL